jgi:hypothetical protein
MYLKAMTATGARAMTAITAPAFPHVPMLFVYVGAIEETYNKESRISLLPSI